MTLPPSNNPPPPPSGGPYPPHQSGGQGGSQYSGGQRPQQPYWAGGPPPPKRGNGWKWALGAVALVAVIAVTAVVSVSVAGGGDGSQSALSADDDGSEYASADDTGPVNIITEDPTCAAWRPISQTMAEVQQKGWNKRDPSAHASDWTPVQRAQYEDVARAARDAADQTVALAKLTPHRVMREFYEQFIAYARAYSDAIPTYTPADNYLAGAFVAAATVPTRVCDSISWSSASARAPLISPATPPSELTKIMEGGVPKRFITEPTEPFCTEWIRLRDRFVVDMAEWDNLDLSLPASEWGPEHRSVIDAAIPVMMAFADDIEELGRSSTNSIVQDFSIFGAQYRRAYAAAMTTYVTQDSYLNTVSTSAVSLIYQACKAVEA